MNLIREQGADHVFNHKEENYMNKIKELYPEGLDLIIEMLADVNLDQDIQILKWKQGRVMVVGNRGSIEVFFNSKFD
jgi:NADPH2:quinone reductase